MAAAALFWLQPYEWRADPDAGARIRSANLRRDHSFYWLELQLHLNEDANALPEPLELILPDGSAKKPDRVSMEGTGGIDPTAESPRPAHLTDLGLKFWLEAPELDGPLKLRCGAGTLTVRSRNAAPDLEDGDETTFHHHRW